MGIHEVTQEQYTAVTGTNPSAFKGKTHPVVRVSWDDATAFCKALSSRTGRTVRLPTEAEWEYACRAGSTTRFHFGDDVNHTSLGDYAWYDANSGESTHPVGRKKPNAWGLYDMHGNVHEWCSDKYGDYRNAKQIDPTGPASGGVRVFRGGSRQEPGGGCRSAHRGRTSPRIHWSDLGLRVVVPADPPAPAIPSRAGGSDAWIRLLDLVNVKEHRIHGTCRRSGASLYASVGPDQKGPTRVRLPIAPEGSYELRLGVIRESGKWSVGVILPVGPSAVALTLSRDNGAHHGLELIGGKTGHRNETGVRPGKLINGREYAVAVTVLVEGDRADIAVKLGDRQIIHWQGLHSSLSLPPGLSFPDPACFGVYATSPAVFKEARLRMISGEAKRVGKAASGTVPGR